MVLNNGPLDWESSALTKVFDIQNAAGERKYTLLSKVVKSCLSLQNSNAIVEHAHKCTGAEHVNTSDKEIIKEMQVAHSNYINREKKEEAE